MPFNREVIEVLRRSYGGSLKRVAEELDLTTATLHNYRNGDFEPSPTTMDLMGLVLAEQGIENIPVYLPLVSSNDKR